MTRAVLLLLTLFASCQGDCGRTDDDGGDADDGMEPADTCKPGDQACYAYEPIMSSTGLDFARADPGESER